MARLQHALDLQCSRGHHGRIRHREVDHVHGGRVGEVAADGIGDQQGIVHDFRLAESFDTFLESSDDGKGQAGELDHFADGGGSRAIDLNRHLIRDHAHFVMGLGIILVEETAGRHDQVPDPQVFGIHAKNLYVLFFAIPHGNALFEVDHRRSRYDAGDILAHGLEIVDGERVRRAAADVLRAALVFGPDFIRTDGLNLAEHVLASSHADGDHEDERSGSDHHAQRGEHEAYFVAAKRVEGKGQNLTDRHLRPERYLGGNAAHLSI